MKAIFVESINGYMAKGPNDNMLWTPSLDKKIFKLFTNAYGGICICSRNTYNLLPRKLINDTQRKFILATRIGDTTLKSLNKIYPNAVLIGGPIFLKSAYDEGVIDTFIITTVKKPIKNNERYKNPFINELIKLEPQCEVDFDEMTVRIYHNEHKH